MTEGGAGSHGPCGRETVGSALPAEFRPPRSDGGEPNAPLAAAPRSASGPPCRTLAVDFDLGEGFPTIRVETPMSAELAAWLESAPAEFARAFEAALLEEFKKVTDRMANGRGR